MPDKYHTLRNVLIAVLLPSAFAERVDSASVNQIGQTLEAIQNCMVQSPAPWPEEWKQEYLETIRIEIERHREASHFAERLEILREGFTGCWEGLTKNKDRALFEVYRCRMRWYVEHLMGTEFPSEDERQMLRNQYTDIWNYAADSLLAQFPFLDPNVVQSAKQDDLNVFYRKIDAPLIPVYLRPMSDEQVQQIKQHWNTRRYSRVDVWRRLGGDSKSPLEKNSLSSNAQRDYELTKQSLSQLLGLVWMVVPRRPDYYVKALEGQANAAKRLVQSKREAQNDQQRLERERSRQVLQTEHISFLLVALLQSASCANGSPSASSQVQTSVRGQNKGSKGGGAYEIENAFQER